VATGLGDTIRFLFFFFSPLVANKCSVLVFGRLLEDNKSLNGTFVNNIRIREQVLHEGDKIGFYAGGEVHSCLCRQKKKKKQQKCSQNYKRALTLAA
jgi:pSer/pThr/pTyr-binding forkhead associated (FHA) protein